MQPALRRRCVGVGRGLEVARRLDPCAGGTHRLPAGCRCVAHLHISSTHKPCCPRLPRAPCAWPRPPRPGWPAGGWPGPCRPEATLGPSRRALAGQQGQLLGAAQRRRRRRRHRHRRRRRAAIVGELTERFNPTTALVPLPERAGLLLREHEGGSAAERRPCQVSSKPARLLCAGRRWRCCRRRRGAQGACHVCPPSVQGVDAGGQGQGQRLRRQL